jgi:hypothetical protein
MGRNVTLSHRWPAWLNAVLLLIASFIGVAACLFRPPRHRSRGRAFPVWWDSQQAFSAAASANAAIVRVTAVPSLLVVRPDGAEGLSRLHEAGAWFAIDPQAIAPVSRNDAIYECILGIGNDH